MKGLLVFAGIGGVFWIFGQQLNVVQWSPTTWFWVSFGVSVGSAALYRAMFEIKQRFIFPSIGYALWVMWGALNPVTAIWLLLAGALLYSERASPATWYWASLWVSGAFTMFYWAVFIGLNRRASASTGSSVVPGNGGSYAEDDPFSSISNMRPFGLGLGVGIGAGDDFMSSSAIELSALSDDSSISAGIGTSDPFEHSFNIDGTPMCGRLDMNGNCYGMTSTNDSIDHGSAFDSSSIDTSSMFDSNTWND